MCANQGRRHSTGPAAFPASTAGWALTGFAATLFIPPHTPVLLSHLFVLLGHISQLLLQALLKLLCLCQHSTAALHVHIQLLLQLLALLPGLVKLAPQLVLHALTGCSRLLQGHSLLPQLQQQQHAETAVCLSYQLPELKHQASSSQQEGLGSISRGVACSAYHHWVKQPTCWVSVFMPVSSCCSCWTSAVLSASC